MENYEGLREIKTIPLWAQLRMAYGFATPEEKANFDTMAKDVIKRGKVTAQAHCPHDCTEYQNPGHAHCPHDCTEFQNPRRARCPHDCTEFQNPRHAHCPHDCTEFQDPRRPTAYTTVPSS